MGHEAVGRVIDAGDARHLHLHARRVVIEPNIPCGQCRVCRRGRGNVCPSKRSLGVNGPGVFAERVAVPADFVHPLPEEMSLDDAVGIEPLAVALHAFTAGAVASGEPVAIIGCGAEGLILAQVAVASGARVLAVDVRPERLEAARTIGAEQVVEVPASAPASPDARAVLEDWSPSVVFESAGVSSAFELALQVVAPGGTVVAVGLASQPVEVQPFAFVRRGLSLVGSLIYDHPSDFQRAIDTVRQGQVRPGALVSRVVDGLDALPAALAALTTAEAGGKTLLAVGSVSRAHA